MRLGSLECPPHPPQSPPPPQRLLDDPDDENRERALDYLAWVGRGEDRRAAAKLSHDPAWKVRSAVIACLREFGGPAKVRRIRAFASDPHPIVRRFAYVAVNDLIEEGAIPWLLQLRETETDDLALIGVEMALFEYAEETAIARVTAYAQSPTRFLCRPARQCLKDFDQPLPPNPTADALDAELDDLAATAPLPKT